MRLSDFDYVLPADRIAQAPLPERSASRMLVLPAAGVCQHEQMRALPDWLRPGDLLVFNDTRVIPARLLGRKQGSGGAVEVLVERVLATASGEQLLAMVRASKTPRPGALIEIPCPDEAAPPLVLEVLGREDEFFRLQLPAGRTALEWLEAYGHLPLPPYIERPDTEADRERYQTVFARSPGAVAAPTAALHFDAPLLAALEQRGVASAQVTLHVGAGTFQPVRVDAVEAHIMHAERYRLPQETVVAIGAARARGGRVVAVGTTVARTLETAAAEGELTAGEGETRLFITPGFRFRVVDLLLTNFHLPRSTLLMLVSAFAGRERVLAAYQAAVEAGYRFFSYGDAMLLHRPEGEHAV